jgi:hypothetical protein
MPDDLTALAWRLSGHPTLTALTTRTPSSLRSRRSRCCLVPSVTKESLPVPMCPSPPLGIGGSAGR